MVWLQWIHYYLDRSELSHPSVLVYCEIYVLGCLWVVIDSAKWRTFQPKLEKKFKKYTPKKFFILLEWVT